MLFIQLFVLIFLSPQLVLATEKDVPKKPQDVAGFILYYQPLLRFENKLVVEYIEALRSTLKNEKDLKLNDLLTDPSPSPFCTKHGYKSCLFLIYQTKDCIPKKQVASIFCAQKAKIPKKDDFSEPVFQRIAWNRVALKINKHCLLKQSETCHKLAKINKEYLNRFRKLKSEKKKDQQKSLEDTTLIKKNN